MIDKEEKETKVTKVRVAGKTVITSGKGQKVEEVNPELLKVEKK